MSNYNPLVEAYKLVVDFHHHGKEVDFDEVIGYLGEALEDHPSIDEAYEEELNNDVPEKSTIKDSGDRTEFKTGAVRDMREGKGRCDLMPLEVAVSLMTNSFHRKILTDINHFKRTGDTDYLDTVLSDFSREYHDDKYTYTGDVCTMLLEVAKHFEEGAKKYGENNWQKGIPVHCYIDSAVRHYLKWLRGDKDEPHDRAFVWNLMCCIWEVDYHKEEQIQ